VHNDGVVNPTDLTMAMANKARDLGLLRYIFVDQKYNEFLENPGITMGDYHCSVDDILLF